MSDEHEIPRTPADQLIGSLFAAAELARLSHEPAYDEAAALRHWSGTAGRGGCPWTRW